LTQRGPARKGRKKKGRRPPVELSEGGRRRRTSLQSGGKNRAGEGKGGKRPTFSAFLFIRLFLVLGGGRKGERRKTSPLCPSYTLVQTPRGKGGKMKCALPHPTPAGTREVFLPLPFGKSKKNVRQSKKGEGGAKKGGGLVQKWVPFFWGLISGKRKKKGGGGRRIQTSN